MGTTLSFIDIELLKIDDNPRGNRARIGDLRHSIQSVGLRTPLEVGPIRDDGTYPILGGSRRYRALRQLQRDGESVPNLTYDAIPCVLHDPLSDTDDMALMLANNIQDELPPSLMADALKRITIANRMTVPAISRAIGLSPGKIRILLHLSEADPEIRRKVDAGELSLTAYYHLRTAPAEVIEDVMEHEGSVTVSSVRNRVERHHAEHAPDPLIEERYDFEGKLNCARADLVNVETEILRSRTNDESPDRYHLTNSEFETLLEIVQTTRSILDMFGDE